MTDDLDLSNLPRFLEHLRARDAASAAFARQVLDAGGVPVGFWGPVQMDVWELRVLRGDMIVRFGVERGYSDGVMIAPVGADEKWSQLRPLRLAVLAWARANGIPLLLEDPDDFDVDLAKNGLATVDWVGDGHTADVDRVRAAWSGYRDTLGRLQGQTRGQPTESRVRAVKSAGVAAIEAAAAPRA